MDFKQIANDAASKEYAASTKKTFEQLKNFDWNGWFDGVSDEWDNEEDAMVAGQEAASQLLEEEEIFAALALHQ
jgi:hypothetical protein